MALISCAITAQLLSAVVFAYADCWFSDAPVHFLNIHVYCQSEVCNNCKQFPRDEFAMDQSFWSFTPFDQMLEKMCQYRTKLICEFLKNYDESHQCNSVDSNPLSHSPLLQLCPP